jgi:hypothetical protein
MNLMRRDNVTKVSVLGAKPYMSLMRRDKVAAVLC